MREYLREVSKVSLRQSCKAKVINTLGVLLLGIILGVEQKWIDGKAINELPRIFEVLDIGHYLGKLSL